MYWHKNDWSECIQSKEISSSRHLRHFIWCNILFSLFLNSCFFFHTYSFHAIEWVYSSECPKITFEFEQRVKNFSWFAVFQIFDFVGLLLLLTDWELRVFSSIRIFVFLKFSLSMILHNFFISPQSDFVWMFERLFGLFSFSTCLLLFSLGRCHFQPSKSVLAWCHHT